MQLDPLAQQVGVDPMLECEPGNRSTRLKTGFHQLLFEQFQTSISARLHYSRTLLGVVLNDMNLAIDHLPSDCLLNISIPAS